MKRTMTIILATIMLLSLASCGTGSEPSATVAPTAETPSAEPSNKPDDRFYIIDVNSANANSSQEPVFETETSVYCLCEGKQDGKLTDVVFVSDKEHKERGVKGVKGTVLLTTSDPAYLENNRG